MSQHQVLKQPTLAFKVISGILYNISQLSVVLSPLKEGMIKAYLRSGRNLVASKKLCLLLMGLRHWKAFHNCTLSSKKRSSSSLLNESTVKPRFTAPRFTGSLDLPGLNSIPLKLALCVDQCKMYPDIPCFSIYRALFLSPKRPGKSGFYCILVYST